MGALAGGALAAGGEVIGVIPRALVEREAAHDGAIDLRVVKNMHERKALMSELADAFIALPGGMGTLEELLETCTWAQLGLHAKPFALLDVGGYWGPLVELFDHAVTEGFLDARWRALVQSHTDIDELLEDLARRAPALRRASC
jgi:uncharacterized protein (TIGR00730 family)